MKSDKNIFLLKIALVVITLIIFADQLGSRDAVGLAGVLATIPLVFACDIVEYFTKRKISRELEMAYLLFILVAHVVGTDLMVYNLGPIYDKVVHFFSGVLTIYAIRELFGRDVKNLRPVVQFLFYVGVAALIGVTWEIYEFTIDQIFGTNMQRYIEWGVADTMIDLISALVGAICAWFYLHSSKRRGPKRT